MVTYRTTLRCRACVEAIRPEFDGDPKIRTWSVDVTAAGKPLMIDGDVTRSEIETRFQRHGYQLLDEQKPDIPPPSKFEAKRYWPLVLIVLYLVGGSLALEAADGHWHGTRAMARFMAGFFLVFSLFKLLNLPAFAEAYRSYDLLAKAWPTWGWIYPFVELGLGVAYLFAGHSPIVNVVTLALMLLGTAGVLNSLMAKRTIQCACLGTVFDLPMSWVTLVENFAMIGMAVVMLVA